MANYTRILTAVDLSEDSDEVVERARAWWREGGGWRASEGREAPPGAVASLPDWALAVGIDEASCGVYWHESAGPEAVDTIADALTSWRDALDETPRGASLDP
jgi:hypothetical protein